MTPADKAILYLGLALLCMGAWLAIEMSRRISAERDLQIERSRKG